jgi:hypothetical protein
MRFVFALSNISLPPVPLNTNEKEKSNAVDPIVILLSELLGEQI